MSTILPIQRNIQDQEVNFRSSISEGTMRDIGGNLNRLLATATAAQVGDIKQAFLSEDQFQAQMGTGWVLLDGRDVTGSTYATFTGNTAVPDARGVFLMNKRNGSSFGDQIPLGDYAADQITNHAHSGTVSITNGFKILSSGAQNAGAGNNRYSGDGSLPNSGTITATIAPFAGINEMRPKSICLNFFMKIN